MEDREQIKETTPRMEGERTNMRTLQSDIANLKKDSSSQEGGGEGLSPLPTNPTAEKRTPSVRTYFSDIEESIKNQNESLATIALAEQKRKEAAPQKSTTSKKSIKIYIFSFLIILVACGILGASYVLFTMAPNEQVPLDTEKETFPRDHTVTLDVTEIDGENLNAEVEETLLSNSTNSGITAVVPTWILTESPVEITSREFLQKIGAQIDAPFMRSFEDEFMLARSPEGSFAIFRVSFYENAFAGMLRFEPHIENGFPFLVEKSPSQPDTNSQTTESVVLVPGGFSDSIIENQDVRIAKNNDGSIRILYAFPNPETLIIAQNKEAFLRALDLLNQVHFESSI